MRRGCKGEKKGSQGNHGRNSKKRGKKVDSDSMAQAGIQSPEGAAGASGGAD